MRPGRFGPVYRAQDRTTGAFVIVKVFRDVPADRAPVAAAAFDRLCRAPLDHPSIVAPLSAGLEGDLPWIAEPQVDGELLDTIMRRGGATVPDVLVRVTQLAGALDFAAAAGIRHGALHPRDILISSERTLVAGFGIQQALAEAGVDAPMHDDVQVLAAIAGEWLAGSSSAGVRAVLESAISGEPHGTALAFAAALQSAIRDPQPAIRDRQPAIRAPQPALRAPHAEVHPPDPYIRDVPPPPADAGLPLRESAPPAEDRGLPMADGGPRIFADGGSRIGESGSAAAESRWPAMAAMLAIGVLGGFAGGFVVGQRDATPTPYAAERAVRRPPPDPEAPASTSGRDDTAPDAPTDVREPDVRIPPAPATRNPDPAAPNQQPGTRSSEPGTAAAAALVVDSRPRGARVFLDGRLVGQTPLSLPGVTPGEHAVRIDLVGYQRWVTRVNVTAGERTRVAASLER